MQQIYVKEMLSVMNIKELISVINEIAPEELQESWDNSGIQINADPEKDIRKIMTCLEISDAVVDEAIEKGVDVVVTHHPLIFSKLAKIDAENIVGGQIVKLVKNGISVYSSHTAFDSASHGTNQDLAEQLDLKDITPMEPADGHPGCGMGRYGIYREPVYFGDFIEDVAEICPDAEIRVAGPVPEHVKKVALCTGAGAEFIDEAYENGADVYITGDVKYHDARHADDIGLCVVDAGHYGTEVLFSRNMAHLLINALDEKHLLDDVEVFPSETNIDPFR